MNVIAPTLVYFSVLIISYCCISCHAMQLVASLSQVIAKCVFHPVDSNKYWIFCRFAEWSDYMLFCFLFTWDLGYNLCIYL